MGYPVFRGTRDEPLVATMRGRLTQFDLLLRGIGSGIQKEAWLNLNFTAFGYSAKTRRGGVR
jgi:hypothetical protein